MVVTRISRREGGCWGRFLQKNSSAKVCIDFLKSPTLNVRRKFA